MAVTKKEDVPIIENGEKLIALSHLSQKIIVEPQYYLNGISGAINECYLREGAVERLLQATKLLPSEHFFVVFDGWRPFEVQMELYQRFKLKMLSDGVPRKRVENKVANFVDFPSKDPAKPSNHLTGGAIDLTIAKRDGPLNMGTDFDDFSNKAVTDAYECLTHVNDEEILIKRNRRLLKGIMEDAGFLNYKEEWWHYDYGNQNWAKAYGKTAIYGGILSLEGNLKT
ncbi:M15 family metallopeptidase [Oceanobacillus salinisoli]|uniref:M15 family metallopeptidase n=1 Tax=Oceanobacillus salinisoli TaxID=2678611 RepID=UPI001E46B9D0|nr:M15 family metallopeptidase [Oceanobacillus salinisoli]